MHIHSLWTFLLSQKILLNCAFSFWQKKSEKNFFFQKIRWKGSNALFEETFLPLWMSWKRKKLFSVFSREKNGASNRKINPVKGYFVGDCSDVRQCFVRQFKTDYVWLIEGLVLEKFFFFLWQINWRSSIFSYRKPNLT